MNRILCRFPARLHFGLLDMNGALGRVDGGIGLAIADPSTELAVEAASAISVAGDLDASMRDRLHQGLAKACQRVELPGASLTVLRQPPPHSGFGSATQMLVGAAKAVSWLANRPLPAAELAHLVGRGGTSGIGSAAVDGGGFILDGGHPFRCGPDSKDRFEPSGAAVAAGPPPVLFQAPFPPTWEILICLVPGLDISGKREIALFERECPVPEDQVARMCRILLMQILPAVLERDLDRFCAGLEAYQAHGFKQAEIHSQSPAVRDCMEFLREQGARGVGMSSWGPVVYAFGVALQPLRDRVRAWMENHGGGNAFITHADNVGHRMLA